MSLGELRLKLASKLKQLIRSPELQHKELQCFDSLISRRAFVSGSIKLASLSALIAAGRVPTAWGDTIPELTSNPADFGISNDEMLAEPGIYSFRVSDELMSYPAYSQAPNLSSLVDSIEGFNWGNCKLYSMPTFNADESVEATFIDKSAHYGPTEVVQVVYDEQAKQWQFEHYENIPVHLHDAEIPADGHHKHIVPLNLTINPERIVAVTLPGSNDIYDQTNSQSPTQAMWLVFILCQDATVILSRKISLNLSLYPDRNSIVNAVENAQWTTYKSDTNAPLCTLGTKGYWTLKSRYIDRNGYTHLWFQNSSNKLENAVYSFIYADSINVYAAQTTFPLNAINDIEYIKDAAPSNNQLKVSFSCYCEGEPGYYKLLDFDSSKFECNSAVLADNTPFNLHYTNQPILTSSAYYHCAKYLPSAPSYSDSAIISDITDSHYICSTLASNLTVKDSKPVTTDIYIGIAWLVGKERDSRVIMYGVNRATKEIQSTVKLNFPGYLGYSKTYFLRGGQSKYGGWRFLIKTENGAGLISQSFITDGETNQANNPFATNGYTKNLIAMGPVENTVWRYDNVPDFRTDTTDTSMMANQALFLGNAHVNLACNNRFSHDFEYVSVKGDPASQELTTQIYSFNHVAGQWSTQTITERKQLTNSQRPQAVRKQFHQVVIEPINQYGYGIPFDNTDTQSAVADAFYYEIRSTTPITLIDHNGYAHQASRNSGAIIRPITKHSPLRFRVLATNLAAHIMIRSVDMGNYVAANQPLTPRFITNPTLGSAVVPLQANDSPSTSAWFSCFIGHGANNRLQTNITPEQVGTMKPKYRAGINESDGEQQLCQLSKQTGAELLKMGQTDSSHFKQYSGDGVNIMIANGLYHSNSPRYINPFLCVIKPQIYSAQLGLSWSPFDWITHAWHSLESWAEKEAKKLGDDLARVRKSVIKEGENIFDRLAKIPGDVLKDIGVALKDVQQVVLSVEKVLSVIPGLSALFLVINAWFDYMLAVIRFIEMFFHLGDMIKYIDSFKAYMRNLLGQSHSFTPPVDTPFTQFQNDLKMGKAEFDGALNSIINNSPFGQDQSQQIQNELKSGIDIAQSKVIHPIMHLIEEGIAKLTQNIDQDMNALSPIIINNIAAPQPLITAIDTDLAHISNDVENTLVDLLGTFISGLGAIADPAQMVNSFLGSVKNVGDDLFNLIEDITQLVQTALDPNNIKGLLSGIWSAPLVTLQIPLLTDLLKVLGVNLSTTLSFEDFFAWTCGMSTWVVNYLQSNTSMTSFNDLHPNPALLSSTSASNGFLGWQIGCRCYENMAWILKYSLKGPAKNNDAVKEFVDNIQLSRLVFKAGRVFSEFLEFYLWEAKELSDSKRTGKLVYKTIAGHLDMAIKLATLFATLIERARPTQPDELKKPTFQLLKTANAIRESLNIFFGIVYSVVGSENRAKDIVHELGSDFGRGATFMTYSTIQWNEEDGKWNDIDPWAEYYTFRSGYLILSPSADLGLVLLSRSL
ncbi:hypothetical protein M9194_16125 [Vibrio sp. S4M6]|uniref:hypothetical protein n=1 Tax=Vibrio sinus TaxID=2946865 RepID=UPI002029DAF0|nr:hypothetical protein [Vibrio sinus]MCL9782957.1 hypothetical protein [Vibrio sinus]